MENSIQEITATIQKESAFLADIRRQIDKAVVGQKKIVDKILIAIFSDGHVLLEGVPGLAKTLMIKTISSTLDCSFKRIQFTPDLLPADIIGSTIYNPKTMEFTSKQGPIFHNIILGDEINRAPAKVQSALLEAMQERQVTIGDTTFKLPEPFLVLATQNPLEQEGTYPLPEAQVDRFFMKITVGYPTRQEEKQIMDTQVQINAAQVTPVISPADIQRVRTVIETIYVDEKLKEYILDIVVATREPEKYGLQIKNLISNGCSPRASIALLKAAKAQAFLQAKGFVSPDDVKLVVMDVLRHRIMLSYEAEAEGLTADDVIQKILDGIVVP
jgi:MoxR-like ATPase